MLAVATGYAMQPRARLSGLPLRAAGCSRTSRVAFSPARGLGLVFLSPPRLTGGLPRMTATLDEKSSAVEASLERLTKSSSMDPALMAVVGLPEGVATYDRDATVAYFANRPGQMAARAFDFLQAYRRVKSAWDQGEGAGTDRGAVLRAELSALGPVSVKIGQTLSQRPDILPEDVCEALKALQTSNAPFADNLAFQVRLALTLALAQALALAKTLTLTLTLTLTPTLLTR